MHEAVSAEVRDEENESEAEVRDQEPEAVSVEEELLSEWKRTVQGRTVSFDFVQNSIFWPTSRPGLRAQVSTARSFRTSKGTSSASTRSFGARRSRGYVLPPRRRLPWTTTSGEAPAGSSRGVPRDQGARAGGGACSGCRALWARSSRLELFLDDEVCYDDARDRVVSGLLDGWACDCEMILGEEVTPLKELPMFGRLKAGARIRLQLSSLCWNTTTPQPMAEPSEKPRSDEGSTAVPETEEDQTDGDVEIVEGLRGCARSGVAGSSWRPRPWTSTRRPSRSWPPSWRTGPSPSTS